MRNYFQTPCSQKEIEEKLSIAEKCVKDTFRAADVVDETIGRFIVHIKKTAPSLIVDTAKLKADGLFESYSKTRAGSESLQITENC